MTIVTVPERTGFTVTSPPDYFSQVGFGLVPNVTRITALGNNPAINIATVPEDIWTGGGVYPWMTAATTLEIVSSSAADAAAGTGARTVLISGLDINYVAVSQVVTLNGTTAVAVPSDLFRINSALMASAGSGKVNAGTLTIRDAGAGTTRAIITIGYGITRQSIYTVPAGFTLQVTSNFFAFNSQSGGNKFARFATYIQSSAGFYRMPFEFALGESAPPYRHDGNPGIILAEKTDYALRCTAVSNDATELTAAWLGIQRRNT